MALPRVDRMEVADLVLPVFAVIVTGWLAGWVGYIPRSLADDLVHFAYNVAMPDSQNDRLWNATRLPQICEPLCCSKDRRL
jgi:hypothetical protein